jgi:hypothetical protein
LFGIGLYELRSAAAVYALLQQAPFEIQPDVFVRFVPHNDRHNHRAMQGTRTGWLMVLAVPLDFRNDYDIANAVAAFGKFHSWHQDDIIKERTLINATFDSPALVPRDIVFGNYSAIGGVKETWTAPVYILGANFAEQLPADEDQMPLNGNPHPLPGNLMPQDNFWALPQYPEIGWNNAHHHDQDQQENGQQGNQHVVQEDVQENDIPDQQAEEELVDDSIVADPSGLASPLVEHGMEVDQPVYNQVIHLGMIRTVFGPVVPPSMQCQKLLDVILPSMFSAFLPKSPRVWTIQSRLLSDCLWPNVADMQKCLFSTVHKLLMPPLHKKKRATTMYLCPAMDNVVEMESPTTPVASFSASSVPQIGNKRKSRAPKPVAIVDTVYRRSTRSCTKRDGHRPVSMSDTVTRSRKKSKAQVKVLEKEVASQKENQAHEGEAEGSAAEVPPETPLNVMQHVGIALGIEPEFLTEEKLKAPLKGKKKKTLPNDK